MKLTLFMGILLAVITMIACVFNKKNIERYYTPIVFFISLGFCTLLFFIVVADGYPSVLKYLNSNLFLFLYAYAQAFSILFIVKMQYSDYPPYIRIMSILCLLCISYLIFFSNNIYELFRR